jgi:hypothetical protein
MRNKVKITVFQVVFILDHQNYKIILKPDLLKILKD